MKQSTSVPSPLEKGDHPELDTLKICDVDQIAQYQSIMDAIQWIVTIGKFDIDTAVITMPIFRMAPRIGHLNRLRRIYGYFSKMQYVSIRVRTEEPHYSDLPENNYDCTYTVYGNVTELLPTDALETLGIYVTLPHFLDANFVHDVTTGRYMPQGSSTLPTRPQWNGIQETRDNGNGNLWFRICCCTNMC
jgi:hypothetical protein